MTESNEGQGKNHERKVKAALYIDGFNLYHSILELRRNYLKWVNLWELGELIIPTNSHELVKVLFCTAYNKKDFDKLTRHQKYVRALEHVGVTCELGHFIKDPRRCRNCGHEWVEDAEKETDVNVAVHLLNDAYRNIFDHGYVLTADSDQAAVARLFKVEFPQKALTVVTPPKRPPSKSILRHVDSDISLNRDHFELSLLPPTLFNPDGSVAVIRPHEYATPPGHARPVKIES